MQPRSEPFFFWYTLLLTLIVISGFTTLAAGRPGGVLATPLHLHLHGAIFLAWYLLLAVQARLIAGAKRQLHRRLGYASVLLALTIVIVGYLVTRSVLLRPDGVIAGRPALSGAVFPASDIVNFTIIYALGFLNRRRASTHKRFMVLTAFFMVDPAMARLVLGLGLPAPLILLGELALIAVLIAYDLVRLGRPHWATIAGLLLYLATLIVKLNVDSLAGWPQVVRQVFLL
jgi:hypothetical protein